MSPKREMEETYWITSQLSLNTGTTSVEQNKQSLNTGTESNYSPMSSK